MIKGVRGKANVKQLLPLPHGQTLIECLVQVKNFDVLKAHCTRFTHVTMPPHTHGIITHSL